MEKNYTDNQILKLIYGECDLFERLEIEYAIENNLELKQVYYMLYNSYKALPKVKFLPSRKSMDNILAYANNELTPDF